MPDAKDPKLALFELYLATAEKVSDRRAQANTWMLSVNSAIVALYGYLQADKLAVPNAQKTVWLWARLCENPRPPTAADLLALRQGLGERMDDTVCAGRGP